MRRLRRVDQVAIALLVPLWAVNFALSVRSSLREDGITPIFVASASNPEDYPAVSGFLHWLGPEESGIRVGDRLLRLQGRDLRGVDRVEFMGEILPGAVGPDRRVHVVYERDSSAYQAELRVGSFAIFWPRLFSSAAVILCGLLLIRSAPPSPLVSALFQTSLVIGITMGVTHCGTRGQALAAIGTHIAVYTVGWPIVLRAFQLFPHGQPPRGRLGKLWPWLFVLAGPLEASAALDLGIPVEVGTPIFHAVFIVILTLLIALVTRAYRRSDALGRRQLRWLILGAYCAFVPIIVASALTARDPRFFWLFIASQATVSLFPLALLVAVVRTNLFDIDRLISRTASYSILIILLALGGEILFEPLAARVASLLGFDPDAGQIAFVVVLAVILIPAQRAWRPYVDQVFFAEGRSVEASVEELLEEVSRAAGAQAVMQRTGDGVERAFRAAFCVIYERAGEVFEPTYVAGSGEFPAIPAASQVIRTLEKKVAPIRLDPRGAAPTSGGSTALPVAGEAVIVPLRVHGAPNAFVGVGPKRSGDVYTSTDLSLLAAVGHAVSAQLDRGLPHEGV